MPRRDRTPPPLAVRVSHEPTRCSQDHLAAAFECLLPVLERQAGRQPRADRAPPAGAARRGPERLRRP
jgi:hypothetical protein